MTRTSCGGGDGSDPSFRSSSVASGTRTSTPAFDPEGLRVALAAGDPELFAHGPDVEPELRTALDDLVRQAAELRLDDFLGHGLEDSANVGVLLELERLLLEDPIGVEEGDERAPGAGDVALREVAGHLPAQLEDGEGALAGDPTVLHLLDDGAREPVDHLERLAELPGGAPHATDALADGAGVRARPTAAIIARGAGMVVTVIGESGDDGRGGQISLLRRDWVARQSQSQDAKVTVEWGQCA